MMTYIKPEIVPWEIRVAHVYFEENPKKGMIHPVLTINVDYDVVQVLQITSKSDSTKFPKVKIHDWIDLGLKKESWLKLKPAYGIKIEKFSPNLVGLPDQWLVDYVKNWMLQNPMD